MASPFDNPIIDWDPDQMGEWLQKIREWKSEQTREPVEDQLKSPNAELK